MEKHVGKGGERNEEKIRKEEMLIALIGMRRKVKGAVTEMHEVLAFLDKALEK